MSTAVIGLDVGFGFTKATDGRRLLLFKTLTGTPPQGMPAFSGYQPGLRDSARDVYLDGQRILLGEAAEAYTTERFATLEQKALLEKTVRPCGLAALAQLGGRSARVNVVTGLPIDYFEAFHKPLADSLLGKHEIGMSDSTGKVRPHHLHVERVRVIPQPFGSIFELLLNDLGQVARPALANSQLGVIDVGFLTVDFCIARNTRLLQEGKGSSDQGMSSAYARIADALEAASGRRVALYRLHEAIEQGAITVDGQVFDLTNICSREFARLAALIGARIKNAWGDATSPDTILVTGGGGAVLAPYLKRIIKGRIVSIKKTADARLGNVRGYWRYGLRTWQN